MSLTVKKQPMFSSVSSLTGYNRRLSVSVSLFYSFLAFLKPTVAHATIDTPALPLTHMGSRPAKSLLDPHTKENSHGHGDDGGKRISHSSCVDCVTLSRIRKLATPCRRTNTLTIRRARGLVVFCRPFTRGSRLAQILISPCIGRG